MLFKSYKNIRHTRHKEREKHGGASHTPATLKPPIPTFAIFSKRPAKTLNAFPSKDSFRLQTTSYIVFYVFKRAQFPAEYKQKRERVMAV